MKKIDNVELHGAANEVVIAAADKNLILPWKEMRQVLAACCISHLVVTQAEQLIASAMQGLANRHSTYPELQKFFERGLASLYSEAVAVQWTYAQSEAVDAFTQVHQDTFIRVPVLEILAKVEEHDVVLQLMPVFSGEEDFITGLALVADFTNAGDNPPGTVFENMNDALQNWAFWDEVPNKQGRTLSYVAHQPSLYNFRTGMRELLKFGASTATILHIKTMLRELHNSHSRNPKTANRHEMPQEIIQLMTHTETENEVHAVVVDISLLQTNEQQLPAAALYFEPGPAEDGEMMSLGALSKATIYDVVANDARHYNISLMDEEQVKLRAEVLKNIAICE